MGRERFLVHSEKVSHKIACKKKHSISFFGTAYKKSLRCHYNFPKLFVNFTCESASWTHYGCPKWQLPGSGLAFAQSLFMVEILFGQWKHKQKTEARLIERRERSATQYPISLHFKYLVAQHCRGNFDDLHLYYWLKKNSLFYIFLRFRAQKI